MQEVVQGSQNESESAHQQEEHGRPDGVDVADGGELAHPGQLLKRRLHLGHCHAL